MKRTFRGKLADIDTEDSGSAKIGHVPTHPDTDLFVRILSWNEDGKHPEFDEIAGKEIKVTVETVADMGKRINEGLALMELCERANNQDLRQVLEGFVCWWSERGKDAGWIEARIRTVLTMEWVNCNRPGKEAP